MKYLKLSEICNPKQWKTLSTEQLLDKGFPVYGANGKIGYYSTYNHELPTIMITCRGATCGSINISEPKSWINGNAMCLDNLSSDVSLKYLAFYLQNYNFNHVISGSAQPQITREGLEKVKVKVYAKELQEKISIQLDKVQKIISESKAILEKYDTLIKSRFIEMFGDIIQNTKNWELKSFTEIAKSRLGKMLDSKKQTGKEKYPYLANFNVQWFRFNLENLNEMDFSEADRIEFALKDGDLLVCEGGEVGRCAVWHNQIENCFFQKAVHRVRLNMDLVHPDYMAYWFKFRSDFNSFDDIVGSKATIAHLTGEKLKLLQIPVPPLSLQNDFASFVQQIDKSKFAVQKSLEKAETLYKSLMQEYFA